MAGCQNKDEFKVVAYKKRKSAKTPIINSNILNKYIFPKEDGFDKICAIRRTIEAKEDILSSDFNLSITASLNEALIIIGNPEIKEIICLGLGKISECMISRYQLALLLCLKDKFADAKVYAYDPIFAENDRIILRHFGFIPLFDNKEGSYVVKNNSTLFFMPHCAKQLTNNLLYANWGVNLSKAIIISNSINNIIDSNLQSDLYETGHYLLSVQPHLVEVAIINSFRFFDIFNDLAIHLFPYLRLAILPRDFWEYRDEPSYKTKDLEFITK